MNSFWNLCFENVKQIPFLRTLSIEKSIQNVIECTLLKFGDVNFFLMLRFDILVSNFGGSSRVTP